MKMIFYLLALVFGIAPNLYSAVDLAIVGGVSVIAPSPLHVGISVNVTFNAQNIGSTAAGVSKTGIYISTTSNISSAFWHSQISMESLAASASSNNIQFEFPAPYTVTTDGNYYVIIKLNDDAAITESNYSNNSGSSTIYIYQAPWAAQNIPYPIIFIHGYMSDNHTWDNLIDSLRNYYGWSYGGNMDFCLNYDNNLTTSNITTDYHDFTGSTGHILNPNPCDLYTINFAVNPSGSGTYNNSVQSNQAAIAKQGRAVQDAIAHVLAVTGKDKVILVCHSMGGLAAREYLQNPNLKQVSDNLKHVAKLLTIGTPHGGTDIVASNLGVIYSTGFDGRSEAIRDLRTGYYYSYYWPLGALNPDADAPGAYLFGGVEDLGYMRDQFASAFYNADVNCDGVVTGQGISGLNQRSLQNDLSYSCIIGNGDALPIFGDGVVTEYSANLNNFLSVNAQAFTLPETRTYYSPADPWHTQLTKQFSGIVQGMDEPNDNTNSHAYSVSSGQIYYGVISYQSVGSPPRDYDNYRINITSSGNLNIQVYNIPTTLFSIDVRNSSNSSVYSIASNGKSYINANIPVTSGNYYVILSGIPSQASMNNPYAFKATFSATTTYCSGTTNLTAPTGTFADGSGSSNYSNNSDCRWKIKPSGATKIILNFSAFNVSNPGDTLYVYNGGTITSPLLAKITGNTIPPNDTSTGGTMLVRFVSDSSNTAPGWAANYSATVVTNYCSGTTNLTSPSGSFADGSGTNNYNNNANCSWLINPQGALSVSLNFSSFVTASVNDVVNVYDGIDENASLLGSFYGSTIPSSLTSSGGAMYVEFITDSITTAAGWNASYSAIIPVINPVSGNPANGIVGYEYWYDNDSTRNYNSVTVLKTFTLNTNFPTQNLAQGLHSLHLRFVDRNGIWSSVVSEYFQKTPVDTGNYNTVAAYEYWYDANNSRNLVSVSPQQTLNLNQNLSTDTFRQGLHSVHVRFKNGAGIWSSVVSDYFQKVSVDTGNYNNITAYEYWYDTRDGQRNLTSVSPIQTLDLSQNLQTDSLQQGLHSVHVRFKSGGSIWSSVLSEYFQKVSVDTGNYNQLTKYEYWYDTSASGRVSVNILPSVQEFLLDTGFNVQSLVKGSHVLHTRFAAGNSLWSSVITDTFAKKGLFLIDSVIAPVCANSTLKIHFVKLATYNTGNVFSIQLSDSSGSFTTPLAIGTKSTTIIGLDSIICTLPKTLKFSNYYKLRLLCTNIADTSYSSSIFTINAVPLATISYTGNLTFCQGGNIILNAATGVGLTYQWKNNGLNITGATGSSDTATVSGSYKVVVTSSNSCFDSSNAVSVTVNPNPNVGFTVNNSAQCLNGNSFIFSDTSTIASGTLTRLWYFGDATTLTTINPTKSYSTSNTFTVKLVSTSSSSCKDSVSKTVTVYPKPNVGFTINNSTQCINGNNFSFGDTSTIGGGTFTRLWNLGSGDTSTIINPNKVFGSAGVYSIKLVLTSNNSCKDSVTKAVTVNPKPNVGFTINNPTQVLTGNSFIFTDTTTGTGNTRLWNLGDGTTDVNPIKIKTYSIANYYTVRLRVTTSAGCIDSTFRNITVLPALPTTSATTLSFSNITTSSMQLTWTNGNGQQRIVLAHASSIVNSNPVNGSNYNANALFGSGSQLGTGNYVIYKGTGNSVIVTGLNMLTTYYFAVIEMNGDTTFSTYQNAPYLTNNATTLPVKWLGFTAKLKDRNSVQLDWSIASEINNDHFEVERSLVENNDWTVFGKVKGNGNSSQVSTYQIMDDVSTMPDRTIYYRVKQVDFDGKYDYSNVASVDLGNIKNDNSFVVYPNPFNNSVYIGYNCVAKKNINIQVFDLIGRLVYVRILELSPSSANIEVDLKEIQSSGIYTFKIEDRVYKLLKL